MTYCSRLDEQRYNYTFAIGRLISHVRISDDINKDITNIHENIVPRKKN